VKGIRVGVSTSVDTNTDDFRDPNVDNFVGGAQPVDVNVNAKADVDLPVDSNGNLIVTDLSGVVGNTNLNLQVSGLGQGAIGSGNR
ncbi:hypothetical protein MKW92_012245, partial [Papaver armeniacum]